MRFFNIFVLTKTNKKIEIMSDALYIQKQINKTLEFIESSIGLKLNLYNTYNTYKYNGKTYFDIETKDSLWMSQEFDKLKRYSEEYNTIHVVGSGYKRVGVSIIN